MKDEEDRVTGTYGMRLPARFKEEMTLGTPLESSGHIPFSN